jgi:tetratricopeptide (TPR) repeat protein
MPDLLAPRRAAHASIRGYLYQSLLGVERWLRLGTDGEPADAILCEGDEDLDRLIRDGIATSEQVKDYSGPLGIGDRVVRETLARFLATWVALRRQGERRRFVFTTTAPRRSPRRGVDVLRLWKAPDRREEVVQGVRDWSRTAAGDDTSQVDEALAWLDEHQAWDELLASVDWGFDAPGIDRIRSEVARLLADRGVDPQLHETLTDRLLARVLEASTRPKPGDRVLTESHLTELLALTERELATWATTPRATQLRQALDEEKALRPLLTASHGELPANAPPSKLLTARYEVVSFEEEGRRREIQRLTDWCRSPEPASVLLLHGPGGAGKTRLLIEWCRRLRHQGWHAGFLDRDAEEAGLGPLFDGAAPRLLVIDYGETRPGLVGAVLHRLTRLPETGGPKVRVALLARTAGEWWRQLQRDDGTVEDLALASPDPIEVMPLVPALEERPQVVARAAHAFAAARGEQSAPEPAPPGDYAHPRYERALYLHVEALLQVLGEEVGQDRPLARILDHERSAWWSHWKEMAGVRAVGESAREAADDAVAAVTLVQGTSSRAETRALIEAAAGPVERETVRHLVDLLHRLYRASDGRFASPLEPDLLGEELVREVLTKDSGLLGRVLDREDERQARDALVVVGRLLLDVTLPLALAEEVLRRVDAEKHLPVSLRDAAATATERVLREHRAAHPEPGEAARAERARLLNNLSNRLADLGRREDALEAIEQAVDIRRKLADARPDAFLPKLAMSLNNLSVSLADLGRREDALEAIEQAVDAYRKLADARPDAFLPDLARSLNNLSVHLADLGRREDALVAIEQAVDIRRKLADARPDAFLPDLAMSLNNLSTSLADLGRREDALVAIEQAVDIRRKLADARPDAFLPDLAMSLNNLSVHLADLGRREDALEAIEQAVDAYRKLADARPDAFLPDLASSLNNLSVRLAALGRREDALEAIEQAVDAYRKLADARPDAFLPDLAGSLNNLSLRLAALGRREDALVAIEQAVDAYRELADARPDAFLPDLATSLNNLSNRLAALGRREDGLVAIEQAVDIRRKLADARPDAFLPDLAGSLNNLSLRLADLGRREDALEAIEQAVDIRRKLADARPDAFLPDLAGSLANQSNRLAHLGRHEDARQSIEDAVRIYAPFFLRLPEAFVDWMRRMVRLYRARCEDAGTEPDTELLEPIERALARLEAGHPQAGEAGDPPDRSTS